MYGCCSNFKKCSEFGECVREDKEASSECFYKTNLDKGLNFYSDHPKNTATQAIIEICGRAFKVLRNEKGLSYCLLENDATLVRSMLKTAGDNTQFIKEDTASTVDPAVYRIEFVYNGTRFNILNYNGYLLTKKTCDTIKQSLIDIFPTVCTVSVGFVEKYTQRPSKGLSLHDAPNNQEVIEPLKKLKPTIEQFSLF